MICKELQPSLKQRMKMRLEQSSRMSFYGQTPPGDQIMVPKMNGFGFLDLLACLHSDVKTK